MMNDDPFACIPLQDGPAGNVRDWVVIKESIFEDPAPGSAYKSVLRDGIYYGFGDTPHESMERLASQLEKLAKAIRNRAQAKPL